MLIEDGCFPSLFFFTHVDFGAAVHRLAAQLVDVLLLHLQLEHGVASAGLGVVGGGADRAVGEACHEDAADLRCGRHLLLRQARHVHPQLGALAHLKK